MEAEAVHYGEVATTQTGVDQPDLVGAGDTSAIHRVDAAV